MLTAKLMTEVSVFDDVAVAALKATNGDEEKAAYLILDGAWREQALRGICLSKLQERIKQRLTAKKLSEDA